jgi:hypothetical protein
MAKLLREVAFVLSIALLLLSNPIIQSVSISQTPKQTGAIALQANSSSKLVPHITCPPPPRDCW